jgi:hypothetical protein
MQTTTNSSIGTSILSWAIALAIVGGLTAYLMLKPTSEPGALNLDASKKPQTMQKSEKLKQEQSQRALPKNYSRQLVAQSEILVKKDLEDRLRRFKEMAKKMRQQKDNLLTKVETRRLPSSAPADANNTAMARKIPLTDDSSLGDNPSVEALYSRLQEYETEIQKNHLAVNAAKQALTKGLSFPEVYNSLKLGSSRMLGFDQLIRDQKKGEEWNRSGGSNAAYGLDISSTADLNDYRGLLGQASRQAGLASARLEGLFGLPRPGQGSGQPGNGQPGQGGPSNGNGSGNGGMAGANAPGLGKTQMNYYSGAKLNEAMVRAQAMPGRRFSKNADRKGWLYINTWYMIGPWENYGRNDFSITHPPEVSIDFDAVYTDGQRGKGVEETDSHPIKVIGREVWLDGTLRWKFMQSESMHNAPPVTTGNSTYYAYTELYFDEETTMLVAIGTDDSGKVWINGKDVWQDNGTSWYHIDEHLAPFKFKQGWNSVLVRLENDGGGATGFSFLIVPR